MTALRHETLFSALLALAAWSTAPASAAEPMPSIVVICTDDSAAQIPEWGKEPPAIVLAGDSTVTDESGWGKGFTDLLRDETVCLNLAQSGRSSRSFRTEGWWQKCLDADPDYLLIQFGHNDQPGKGPERESEANGDFRKHLREFVDEARAAGIQPVLITPLTRRRWSADGKIIPTLTEYAEATATVASEKQVPLIDLHALSIAQCELAGPEVFRAFEPMSDRGADHTHLNSEGSRAAGFLVARALMSAIPEISPLFSAERMETSDPAEIRPKVVTQDGLTLEESSEAVTIRQGNHQVLTYNKVSPLVPEGIDAVFERSGFLHPVVSPAGQVVTAAFPADHPHQDGIFSAWVRTRWADRNVDFWNLAGGTGRVLHQRLVRTFTEPGRLGFEADLVHRAVGEPVIDILRERWRITVHSTDGNSHLFDLHTTQTALTDKPLMIEKYHYGGVALRGPVRWLAEKDGDAGSAKAAVADTVVREPCNMCNDLGSDRIRGNHEHARWVMMSGQLEGKPVSIAVLSHSRNFRSPQAVRMHPTKPYFVYAPCVDGEFIIDQDHPFVAQYRFIVTDSVPDPKWLDSQWTQWNDAADP